MRFHLKLFSGSQSRGAKLLMTVNDERVVGAFFQSIRALGDGEIVDELVAILDQDREAKLARMEAEAGARHERYQSLVTRCAALQAELDKTRETMRRMVAEEQVRYFGGAIDGWQNAPHRPLPAEVKVVRGDVETIYDAVTLPCGHHAYQARAGDTPLLDSNKAID